MLALMQPYGAWVLRTPSLGRRRAGLVMEESIGSSYPEWPEGAVKGERELGTVLTSFVHVATAVPLDAASDPGDPWESWLDGGFEAHKCIHRSISRTSYVEVLGCLQCVLAQCQATYPDLWAVLKFIPKKNGLNPVFALLTSERGGPLAVSIEHLKPRQARRHLFLRTLHLCIPHPPPLHPCTHLHNGAPLSLYSCTLTPLHPGRCGGGWTTCSAPSSRAGRCSRATSRNRRACARTYCGRHVR